MLKKRVIPCLDVRDGRVTRGWIGVEAGELSPELAQTFGVGDGSGVLLTGILQAGPAAQAGLQPGDVVTQVDGIAVLHLNLIPADAVEAFHHAEGFLVPDNLDLRIIFLDQCDRSAMVGLHVVDNQIIDGFVTNHFTDMFHVLGEEVHLYRINQTDDVIIDQV